jgi:hypothetical protein
MKSETRYLEITREGMTGPFYRARRVLRRHLWRNPTLYRMLHFALHRTDKFSPGAHLVVDGFARSGNTTLCAAIKLLARHVRVIHHGHSPAYPLYGIKMSIPSYVIMRKPWEAAMSLCIYSDWNIIFCLERWIDYYREVDAMPAPLRILTFEDVTQDPVSVAERVLLDAEVRIEPSLRETITIEDIEKEVIADASKDTAFKRSWPDPIRKAVIERLDESRRRPDISALIMNAEELYRQILGGSKMFTHQSN